MFFFPKYAVGLGNFWRFPYLCYKNGGGAFLVVYWTLSICAGLPIVVLEQSLGQYTSQGPLHCWRFAPALTGLGTSMVFLSFFVCCYYAVIITWGCHYLFSSFAFTLPWVSCDPEWADYRCEPDFIEGCGENNTLRGDNGYCYNGTISNSTENIIGLWNESLAEEQDLGSVLAPEQYFHFKVLGDANVIDLDSDFGLPRWQLAIPLLTVWTLIFFSLLKGIKSSGKVIWFTTLAPYVV